MKMQTETDTVTVLQVRHIKVRHLTKLGKQVSVIVNIKLTVFDNT